MRDFWCAILSITSGTFELVTFAERDRRRGGISSGGPMSYRGVPPPSRFAEPRGGTFPKKLGNFFLQICNCYFWKKKKRFWLETFPQYLPNFWANVSPKDDGGGLLLYED